MKNLIYSVTCLAFTIMVGGAVYEHLTMVPRWSAAPPASLSMFQGEYGIRPDLFWMIIHPIILLLFVVTLILHWKTARRKNLLTTLIVYIIILVITSIYFVPELISITTTPFTTVADAELTKRAGLWEILSITRLVVLLILSIILFVGLTKPVNKYELEGKSAMYTVK